MSAAAMERPQQNSRQRSKSTFSFKSDHSQGSHSNSHHDKSGHQRTSSKDIEKPHLHAATKADPNAAMTEVQPIAAALEKPTLQSLRSFQHTDTNGNPIAEPDISNPTRSRWERPLDTIRSFEAAIDNEYKRRSHQQRAGGDAPSEVMSGYGSRRSSYYGGGYEQNRYSQQGGGYYGRQSGFGRDSWENNNGYGPGNQRTRYNPNRMQSDPGWNRQGNGQNVYPTPGYQQSRDTVITGGSNGSNSEPYSNEPSENSSIERGGPVQAPVMRPDMGEQYGFSGFGGGIPEEYGNGGPSNNGYFQQSHNNASIPPPVPAKTANPNVIRLTNSQEQGASAVNGGRPNVLSRKSTETSEKRKSWFKKRFSKN